VYGSSGDHNQRRRLRELLVINTAVDAIKSKHGVKAFVLSGQSGGGHIVGSLLSLRQDIICAVITSGAVAVQQRSLIRGWAGVDATGYSDYFDPIDHVAKISRDPGRRIFIIGDPRDTNVPFETQVAFFNKQK
jgi:poly(3-hydroxybutyrate) depolymerase